MQYIRRLVKKVHVKYNFIYNLIIHAKLKILKLIINRICKYLRTIYIYIYIPKYTNFLISLFYRSFAIDIEYPE